MGKTFFGKKNGNESGNQQNGPENGGYRQDGGNGYYQQGGPENSGYRQDGGNGYYQQGGPENGGYRQDGGNGYYQQGGPGNGYYGQGPSGNGYNSRDYNAGPYSQGYQQGQYGRQNGYGPGNGYDDSNGGRPDQSDYEPGKRHLKKKKRKSKRAIMFALEVLVLVILGSGLFVWSKFAKLDTVSIPKSEIVVNEDIGEAEQNVLSGYTNIALYGVDSRSGQLVQDAHSDTIIIASINRSTKEIKLASVYRDTYLDNTNGEYRKATECYYFGGPKRSIDMLNKNLDLDIDMYVAVDFNVVADVVDRIGGVEIDVTEEEIQWINGYQEEGSQVTGKEIVPVTQAGTQTLNGLQTLSYCRIRYTSGDDFKRTERQRTVVQKIFEKAKTMDLLTLNGIIDDVFPSISTNMNALDILNLAMDITSYQIGESTGFPFSQVATKVDGSDVVVPVNLAANVQQLHQWLFGSTDYTPSSTVQEISNYIISYTGIQ